MSENMNEKNRHLGEIVSNMERVMVAFSGGVDSALVLKRAQQELGDQVLAVVVSSELFREQEFEDAVKLAKDMGVPVHQTEIKELEDEQILDNTPESWYYSKKLLYSHLKYLAEQLGFPYVLDGMIMDDLDDFRPGLKARTEQGIRSVLQEAGIYKQEVRKLAKQVGLPVWDKPASCSIASRFPYGTKLDKEKVQQVDQAEIFLAKLGFSRVRVRFHEHTARIEVSPKDISEVMKHRDDINMKLTSLGFTYVSLDLSGYRTGSMNEVLPESTLKVKTAI